VKYSLFLLFLLGMTSAAIGQYRYQPRASVGGYRGYGGGYRGSGAGSTAAGSAMAGMSDVISAKGNYNLNTSAAAVNMTEAQRNEIQNREQYTNAYFQMRQENRAYRAQESGPRPTEEQVARMAAQGVPQPVSSSQVDQLTGKINWPGPLQMSSFSQERATVEQLMANKSQNGSLSYADQMTMRKVVNDMVQQLKEQISSIPPQDYETAKQFLNSLLYETTHTDVN
jgi:hypothetical protein